MGLIDRFKRAVNVFAREPTRRDYYDTGPGYSYRPDRVRFSRGNERSIITSVYNRIALDASAINIRHVILDNEGRYKQNAEDGLHNCLTLEANKDQTGRAFIQDVVMSMMDEGCVAIIPIDTTDDPVDTDSYGILTMRTGKILEWYPNHVLVRAYNDRTGRQEDIKLLKSTIAIIENPFFAVMNEHSSTMQRLIRKLNLLDSIDEQSGSGKLDLIIQLPYTVKSNKTKKLLGLFVNLDDYHVGSTKGGAITRFNQFDIDFNQEKYLIETRLSGALTRVYSAIALEEDVTPAAAEGHTDLPKVGANDDGIWRRLVVIPFNAKITGKSDIKNYADYLFDHAGPAIMNWIIEGAKRAIDKNFHTTLPDVVEAAIQAYREDNDWLGHFLEECCEIDPSYKEKSGELYQAYRAHCMQNGEYIRSTTDFYSSMDKAGYNRIRKNTGVQVVGLKLKEGQDFLE